MKKFRLQHILLLVLAFGLFQCSESDDVNPLGGSFTPDYKNQPLQGKIAGEDWTSVSGTVSTLMLGTDTFQHQFSVMDTLVDTTFCTGGTGQRSFIFFFLQDENAIVVPGEKKLKLDFNNLADNYTVTFVSYDDDGNPENNIATKGAYEILTVDTTNRLVTGRMDIPLDDNNFVNGNFSIRYCNF